MTNPILYGVTFSPFVRKIAIMLEEKGVIYHLEELSPLNKTPEFLAISPAGKIPVYRDAEGRIVNDSAVIAAYIEECYTKPSLYPTNRYERSRSRWFEVYAGSTMGPVLVGYFFEKIVRPNFMKQPPNEEAIKTAEELAPGILDYLESQIKGKKYFAADMFSVGDIALACTFINMHHAGFSLDDSKHPELKRWYSSITSRPSVSKFVEKESAAIKAMQNK